MALYVVFQWSVLPEDEPRCKELVAAVVEHIKTEHDEISGTRLFTQWTGPLPRRAFIWTEEYEDLDALNQGEVTSACLEVWKEIERMSQPGTWTTSVWFDGPGETSWSRAGA